MKTPFSDFEFDYERYYHLEQKEENIKIQLILRHKELPIEFYVDGIANKNLKEFLKGVNVLYEKVLIASKENKSKPPEKGWHTIWYFGEYDHDRDQWFVLNRLGDKAYTNDELKDSFIYDELNIQ